MNIIFPKINLKIERWKWNKEYRIYVSSLGHFKDEHKKSMPILINSSGYCSIETPYGIKAAHRLVLLTFRPIPNAEALTVDHLNHNKRCNELNNLEWVTKAENLERAKKDYINLNQEHLDKKIITLDGIRFNNINDAVYWIAKKYKLSNDINLSVIKRRLISAINLQKEYFGRTWRYDKR